MTGLGRPAVRLFCPAPLMRHSDLSMSNTPERKTQAKGRRAPPWKLAPPDTATFTLVLLDVGCFDRSRVACAAERIVRDANVDVRARLAGPLPLALEHGLSHADALLGQFELVCCDCISVFICDQVLASASSKYLTDLFARLRASPEFDLVAARLESVPLGPDGLKFSDRFLGRMYAELPLDLRIMRKKARSMAQAAESIGARLILSEE
jgi:hypothetical protein